jgi:DNA excision repair protein ERCC-2
MVHLDLSVHDIVDLILRTGDLDSRIFNRSTMNEGTKLHQVYQRKYAQSGYQAEVGLTHDYVHEDVTLHVTGKADGVYVEDDLVIIEEIKTTVADLKVFHKQHERWHMMQAAFYGHMLASQLRHQRIEVRLIYMHQATLETYAQTYQFTLEEITKDVQDVIVEYVHFYQLMVAHQHQLKTSLASLTFPFATFRDGQRQLAKYVYGVSKQGGRLFVEAPTGIGKTMSTLFPMVKQLGTSFEKIFYFTAKNSGKVAAMDALETLRKQLPDLSYVVITAKDQMSFCPKGKINPDDCLYARGYYDKIKDVLTYALTHYQAFNKETIQALAEQFKIEPFELSLDLSLFVDVVIADYNYLFDPTAYLRRFFEQSSGKYGVLIDEAHNLVERSRDMFSATLSQSQMDTLKKAMKKASKPLKTSVNKLIKLWKELIDVDSMPTQITLTKLWITTLEKFIQEAQVEMKRLRVSLADAIMDIYFKCVRFVRTYDLWGDHYRVLVEKIDGDITLHLWCLNPSIQLKKVIEPLHAVVMFSATLSPIDFFIAMLGGSASDSVLRLTSPFPQANFKVMLASQVKTTLKKRELTMQEVAIYIESALKGKIGNYLVFFPSYQYLESVKKHLTLPDDTIVLTQTKLMSQDDKASFLSQFNYAPKQTTLGMAVLGGIFSEGIDLVSDRLIGVMIVSVGLPQISYQRDLIASYFDKHDQRGFNYAYVFPAINKVLQAMGRVIRSETDRGFALLLDERYLQSDYHDIRLKYPQYIICDSPDEVEDEVQAFFRDQLQ